MEKTDNIMKLISHLEPIVANCYHNQQKRGGFYYRYPVKYKKNGDNYESRGRIPDPSEVSLDTMRYETGANQLYIGRALFNVLEYLEDRYGLDFDELEFEEGEDDGGLLGDPFSDFFGI